MTGGAEDAPDLREPACRIADGTEHEGRGDDVKDPLPERECLDAGPDEDCARCSGSRLQERLLIEVERDER